MKLLKYAEGNVIFFVLMKAVGGCLEMKRAVSDRFQRAGYLSYYVFVIIFGLFLSYDFLVTNGISIVCTVLALTVSWLALIIVINFYRSIRLVEYLLPSLITVLFQLFIISTVQELLIQGLFWYTLGIKTALYFFCIEQQGLHFLQLKSKLSELRA